MLFVVVLVLELLFQSQYDFFFFSCEMSSGVYNAFASMVIKMSRMTNCFWGLRVLSNPIN